MVMTIRVVMAKATFKVFSIEINKTILAMTMGTRRNMYISMSMHIHRDTDHVGKP